MKSLKRTLCLVLALVMVLGLFGIASATDFTDDNTIQYKEAVEVVTGIGAINGMGDGTFNPKGTITRAQAAKLVTYVALSKDIADGLNGVTSSFTDVTAEGGFAWAIPSIEYMVKEGIINGMGDGTFNPNGEINGYAVLKMLLCVLGYGKQDEYVGHQWTLQVAVDASRKGVELTKGRVKGAPALSEPATREELALYCFNALGVPTVVFDKDIDSYIPDDVRDTIGEDVYGLTAEYGVVAENAAISADCAKESVTLIGDKYYKMNTGLDMIGHYVRVYADSSSAGDGTGADNATDTYAIVDQSTVVTLTTAEAAKITDATTWAKAFGKDTDVDNDAVMLEADYKTAVSSGITKDTEAAAGTYMLGVDPATKATSIYGFIGAPAAGFTVMKVTNVTPVNGKTNGKVILSADGSAATKTITLPGSEDTATAPYVSASELYSLYDGIAKDDIVVVLATGDFMTVVKATTEEGTITSSAEDATTQVKTFVADGKTYTVAGTLNTAVLENLTLNNTALGKKCTIYMGPDGRVIGLKAVAGASEDAGMVYVVGGWVEKVEVGGKYGEDATVSARVNALCVNMDGELVDYPVGFYAEGMDTTDADNPVLVDGSDPTDAGIALSGDNSLEDFVGKFVTVATAYDETMKGDLATLTLASEGDAVGKTVNVGKRAASTALTSATVKLGDHDYLDASTKFIFVATEKDNGDLVLSATKTAVLTKDQALAGATATNSVCDFYSTKASAAETNYTVKYVVVTGESTLPTSTDGAGLIFVPKFDNKNMTTYDKTQADGTKKATPAVQTTVLIDGTPKTIITQASGKDAVNSNDITTGFYTYKVDTDGLYTLTPETSGVGIGVVTNVYNGKVTTTNTDANALSDVSLSTAKFNLDLPALTGSAAHGDIGIGDNIAYTYSTTDGVKTVTGVYYLGTVTVELTANSVTDENKATVNVTASATSSVADDTASGYAWMKGAASASVTTAKLDVSTFKAANAGTYFCIVTMASGLKGVSGNVVVSTTGDTD